MDDSLKSFWLALGKSSEMQAEVTAIGPNITAEQTVEVAAKHGYTLAASDVSDPQPLPDGELSEQDLANVAGGGRKFRSQRSLLADLRDFTRLPKFPMLMQTEYSDIGGP